MVIELYKTNFTSYNITNTQSTKYDFNNNFFNLKKDVFYKNGHFTSGES